MCLFFIVIYFASCKSKVELTSVTTKEVNTTKCPEEGTCSVEILENKALQIKTDEMQGIYPKIVHGEHFVLKFEYINKGNTSYQDSSYREEIFVELDKNNLEFETENLKDKKLFFARWCYCKGQTGYYKINKGKLSVTKIDDENFHLGLSFKIDEVPQIINEIKHTFNLQ